MNPVGLAVATFAALLPITNPLGAVAVFAGLTAGQPTTRVRRQALMTGVYVAAILAVFGALGGLVLEAFGITIAALQIAGGLVVAHSGFGMISPSERISPQEKTDSASKQDISFSPMALPLVAGPGAIGVVVALGARNPGVVPHVAIVGAALALGALIAVALRFGTPLIERLGPTGIGALTRVMGFLILAIGVELVVHGVQAVTQ